MTQKGAGDIVAELEDAARNYVSACFVALWAYLTEGAPIDYDGLGFWTFPMMFAAGGKDKSSFAIFERDAFDAMVRAGYDQFYREGWCGRGQIDSLKATVVADRFGLVAMTGARFRSDGSICSRWDTIYIWRQTAEGWKQIGCDAGEPPRSVAEWSRWLSSLA